MPDFFILKHLKLSACAQSGSGLSHKRFNNGQSQTKHSSYNLNSQFCYITSKLLYKSTERTFQCKGCRIIQLTLRRSGILDTDQASLLAKLIIMTTQFNPTLTIRQPRHLLQRDFVFGIFYYLRWVATAFALIHVYNLDDLFFRG